MLFFKKKKAFTLSELLVVVIVLGILAAVSVPKFTRVLETRKTTEAEDIFAAVRTEQENRCLLGKTYQTDKSKVQMLSSVTGNNYQYNLTEQGITASSDKGYQLKMLSYKDGSICCEGAYCDSLNKSYVPCSSVTVAAYDECAAEIAAPEPEPEPACDECTCEEYAQAHAEECGLIKCDDSHKEGEKYESPCTCGKSTGRWHCGADTKYTWTQVTEVACKNMPSSIKRPCDDGAGTQTMTNTCVNGEWVSSEWSECVPNKTCDEPDTANGCASGTKWICSGTNKGWCWKSTWNEKTCSWSAADTSSLPTYCPATIHEGNPNAWYCTCEGDPEEEEQYNYVWRPVWTQTLLGSSVNGRFDHYAAKNLNQALMSCKGNYVHSWDDLSNTCSSGNPSGSTCSKSQVGSQCATKSPTGGVFGTGTLKQFCELNGNKRGCISLKSSVNDLCDGLAATSENWIYDLQSAGSESLNFFSVTMYECVAEAK